MRYERRNVMVPLWLYFCFSLFWSGLMLGAEMNDGAGRTDMANMVKKLEQKRLLDFLAENRENLLDDADKVVERYLAVTGGRNAWEKIRTLVLTYRVCDPNGGNKAVTKYYQRPSFFRQDMSDSDTAFISDGQTAWKVKGKERQKLENSAFTRMSSIDDFFLDYKHRGIKLTFKAIEILSGTPVYRVERQFPDGYSEDLYFSVQTGLLSEKFTPYIMGARLFMSFWDFRKVSDVLLPHTFIRSGVENGPPHGGVLIDVKVNVPLDESLFACGGEAQ